MYFCILKKMDGWMHEWMLKGSVCFPYTSQLYITCINDAFSVVTWQNTQKLKGFNGVFNAL